METNNNTTTSTSLYIPVNIKTRFEFFDGYGFAELLPTILAALGLAHNEYVTSATRC